MCVRLARCVCSVYNCWNIQAQDTRFLRDDYVDYYREANNNRHPVSPTIGFGNNNSWTCNNVLMLLFLSQFFVARTHTLFHNSGHWVLTASDYRRVLGRQMHMKISNDRWRDYCVWTDEYAERIIRILWRRMGGIWTIKCFSYSFYRIPRDPWCFHVCWFILFGFERTKTMEIDFPMHSLRFASFMNTSR